MQIVKCNFRLSDIILKNENYWKIIGCVNLAIAVPCNCLMQTHALKNRVSLKAIKFLPFHYTAHHWILQHKLAGTSVLRPGYQWVWIPVSALQSPWDAGWCVPGGAREEASGNTQISVWKRTPRVGINEKMYILFC